MKKIIKEYRNELEGKEERAFNIRIYNQYEDIYIQPVLDEYAEYIKDMEKSA